MNRTPFDTRRDGAPIPASPRFSDVLERELEAIDEGRKPFSGYTPSAHARRPGGARESPIAKAHRLRLFGLALSGGGIRSATFNLGVLESLAKRGLLKRIDYVSSVSGGGYIACWLHAWIERASKRQKDSKAGLAEVETQLAKGHGEEEPGEVRWLRRYSNYLTPRSGMFGDGGPAAFAFVRNLLLNVLLLVLLLSAVFLLLGILIAASQGWSVTPVPLGAGVVGSLLLLLGFRLAGRETVRLALRASASSGAEESALERGLPGVGMGKEAPAEAVRNARLTLTLLFFGCALLGWATVAKALSTFLTDQATQSFLQALSLGVLSGASYAFGSIWGWRRGRPPPPLNQDELPRFLDQARTRSGQRALGACVGGAVLGLLVFALGGAHADIAGGATSLLTAVYLVPALLASVALATIVQLGVAGRGLSEPVREWWNRTSASLIIMALVWAVIVAFALYGPFLVAYCHDALKITAVAGWMAATGVGLFGKWSEKGFVGWRTAAALAPYLFLTGLLLLVTHIGYSTADWLVFSDENLPGRGAQSFQQYLGTYVDHTSDLLDRANWGEMLGAEAALLGILLALSFTVDINVFSLHMFYRARLERGFLGASRPRSQAQRWVDVDPHDSPLLKDLTLVGCGLGQRPYPLVNTAINLTRVENLAWAERKAASFVFTPDFCGYELPHEGELSTGAYQPTREFGSSNGDALSLGETMTISGAAVNPNSCAIASPALAALMTIFNLRLGQWVRNPARADCKKPGPVFSLVYLLKELLRKSDEHGRFVHLSDGAHFENLGLYELVRRRCRYIIVSDAGRDPKLVFADLSNAIRKCRVDLGVEIELCTDSLALEAKTLHSGAHGVAGVIHYPNAADHGAVDGRGYLLYLKATVTGDEPSDVAEYKSAHPTFPHEPTGDQWFGESQFESYRALGEHAASNLIEAVFSDEDRERQYRRGVMSGVVEKALSAAGKKDSTTFEQHTGEPPPCDLESLFRRLSEHWRSPAKTAESSTHLHERLSRIVNDARTSRELRFLDWQIFPEWNELRKYKNSSARAEAWGGIPRSERQLRAGFYFCCTLISFMEGVYDDLKLDSQADHPDHRGWINLFRRWAGAPMFRSTWAVVVPNHGTRFQKFAERNFGLYAGAVVLGEWHKLSDLLAKPASDAGKLSFPSCVERDQLARLERSHSFGKNTPLWDKLYAVPLIVHAHNPQSLASADSALIVGMAVLTAKTGNRDDDGPRLYYFRIRDHLRKMGLGRRGLEALWRFDCTARLCPCTEIGEWIPEADASALGSMWRSVRAVVPHDAIRDAEALLVQYDDPKPAGGVEDDPERADRVEPEVLLNEAVRAYDYALRRQPDNEEALRGLARVLRRRAVRMRVGTHWAPAKTDAWNAGRAPVVLTEFWSEGGDPSGIVRRGLQVELASPPEAAPVELNIAIELLNEVVRKNRYAHLALYNLACCLLNRGLLHDEQDAIHCAKRALLICPGSLEFFLADPDMVQIRERVLTALYADAPRTFQGLSTQRSA